MELKIITLFLLLSLLLFTPTAQIDSISPDFGLNNEVVNVVISGDKFNNQVTVKLVKPGAPEILATNVKVISKKQIQCSFDLHGQAVGQWDLIVANGKQINPNVKVAALTGGFTIQYPEPTVSGIGPNQGLSGDTVIVNLTGTGFRTGAKLWLNAGERVIEATDVEVISDTQISALLDLADTISGSYQVTVTNDDGKSGSLIGGFEIQYPEPAVWAVEPDQGLAGDTVVVNLTGTGFRNGPGLVLKIGEQVIAATDVEAVTDTQISAVFDLADTIPGSYDVIVTNDDGKSGSLDGGFEIQYPEPTVWGIEPAEGAASETVAVNLTGAGFHDGAVIELKAGELVITATDVETVSDTQISAVFDLAEAVPGSCDIIVTNDDGKSGSLDGGFVIIENPAIDSEVEDETASESTDENAVEDEVTPDFQELNRDLKPVFFDYDKFVIRPDQVTGLEADIKILNENPDAVILLGGHTDERGIQKYNLGLSEKRAEAIRRFLLENGIDSSRIMVYAYGEDHPVKKGHDESSWRFNRRVDISVWQSPPTREQGLEIMIYCNDKEE